MSEDKLRQDIRGILEDARFSITASDKWIDRFIARVRAEDAVSVGVKPLDVDHRLITDALAEALDGVLDMCFNRLPRETQSISERVLVKYRQWRQTHGLRDSYAIERLLAEDDSSATGSDAGGVREEKADGPEDDGGNEASPHPSLARPSSPSLLPAPDCPCSLCTAARLLGLTP